MGRLEEDNKRIVRDYHHTAFVALDYPGATKFFGAHYIQHNPHLADGAEGIKAFIDLRKEKFPRSTHEIKRIFAEGDYVICHILYVPVPGTPGTAVVDIYRLEDGKLVEHWDVVQELPAHPANNNGAV